MVARALANLHFSVFYVFNSRPDRDRNIRAGH